MAGAELGALAQQIGLADIELEDEALAVQVALITDLSGLSRGLRSVKAVDIELIKPFEQVSDFGLVLTSADG